jgi:LuxR family maltose regulon positive regulatory protein
MADRQAPQQVLATAALLVHGSATELGHHDVATEVTHLAEGLLGPTGEVALMRARAASGSGSARDRSTAATLRSVLDGTTPVVVPWTRIEARVVLCDLALAGGRRPQARHELDRALHAAATSRALRPLLAGGSAVVDLLARQLGSFGAGDVAAERVLEHRGFPRHDDVALTDRERDVLALLATSLSLRDIAARLDVAPSTVKTHLRAVYGKLSVTSRREAVAAGRRRGALSAPG